MEPKPSCTNRPNKEAVKAEFALRREAKVLTTSSMFQHSIAPIGSRQISCACNKPRIETELLPIILMDEVYCIFADSSLAFILHIVVSFV
jgi:hypothetical protein